MSGQIGQMGAPLADNRVWPPSLGFIGGIAGSQRRWISREEARPTCKPNHHPSLTWEEAADRRPVILSLPSFYFDVETFNGPATYTEAQTRVPKLWSSLPLGFSCSLAGKRPMLALSTPLHSPRFPTAASKTTSLNGRISEGPWPARDGDVVTNKQPLSLRAGH